MAESTSRTPDAHGRKPVGAEQRTLSGRAVFGLIYATSAASVYFALGVIVHHANGVTPYIFIFAGLFFQLTAMSYAEGASTQTERGGSAAFARRAFNELVSFTAGWAVVLDYILLIALATLTIPAYLAVLWPKLGHGTLQVLAAFVVIVGIAIDNLTGVSARRLRQRTVITVIDLLLQGLVVALGLVLIVHPHHLTATVHFGRAPTVKDLGFALPISVVAFAGLESAASVGREVAAPMRKIGRLIRGSSLAVVVIYVGVAVVGIGGLPVHNGVSALGTEGLKAPMVTIAAAFHPHWLAQTLKYLTAIGGALVLLTAADVAMLGVTRTGYALATNRQIPTSVGRLSQRWSTPWVVILFASLASAALVVPHDLAVLTGIYAFGALVSFLIAHLSVIKLRFRERDAAAEAGRTGRGGAATVAAPARDAPSAGYRIPFSISIRGAKVPLPAVLGAVLSTLGLISVVVFRPDARYVGLGWLIFGVAMYVGYRKFEQAPVLRRLSVPEAALRPESDESDYGSILVPIFGTAMDDEIIQTAGRLAGAKRDELTEHGATIEAISVIEVPMALPLDAPLPKRDVEKARAALNRAKAVGEEYEGVEVATAILRGRRTGEVIVREAKRRGVEVIVLAADEAMMMRGGSLLGASMPLENFIGTVTKYVINKSPCRVILTAPPLPATAAEQAATEAGPAELEAETDGDG